MIVLGLDTTGAACSCALVKDGEVLAHFSETMNRGHAERLAPMAAEVMSSAGVTAADIDKIVVCTGPGSFTGQRVAMAFALGFALPRRLLVVGIDALQVKAEELRGRDNLVGVMRDIRRGQVFYASYSHGLPLSPARAMTLDDAQNEADILQASIYEASSVDTRILARLGADFSPEDYPAKALYSRPPDAKLPGGIEPDAL